MADQPKPAVPAAAPGAAGEPSMEEILASIRRILSEDEGAGAASGPADAGAPPRPAEAAEDGVLQLTEEMLAERGPQAAPPAPPAPPMAEPPPATMAFQPPSFPAAPAFAGPPPPSSPDGLLEAGTAAAAAAALGALTRGSGPSERPVAATAWPLGNAGLTIEDIVRQELRPLLSAWLNSNLPRIVEEAVAREMERVRARIG